MIKIEKVSIYGFEEAIRGMRNAMNSWDRIDSQYCGEDGIWDSEDALEECPACPYFGDRCMKAKTPPYLVGPNDLGLMNSLSNGGPVHAKYRRFIVVYLDITAPLYWWKEFDTYRVGVAPNPADIEMNSCSTMHKIHAKEFTRDDFSWDHLLGDDCVPDHDYQSSTYVLDLTIESLNFWRDEYLTGKESGVAKDKRAWWQMIQLLPSSYNQKRTIMLNYEVLANIYEWRRNHKLNEWRDFCKWIETLPYSELIVGEPKTEVAYLCDGEQCNPCNNIDCAHTLDIKHAVNFEKVGDHKYMEKEHNPLAHPETYVADAIDMIGDMTEAQRVEVMKYLKVKTPEECPYWDYKEHKSLGTCNGCEAENQGIIINGDRYCNIVSPTKEEE